MESSFSAKKALMLRVSGVLFLGLVALLGTGFLTLANDDALTTAIASNNNNGECEHIKAKLVSTADFSNFTTQGVIRGDLKGTTMFTGNGSSLTPITSTTAPPHEPLTFSYTGSLEIVTKEGSLTTTGVGVFEGVPFGVGTQFDHVTGGTGDFEGATGVLYFNFVADESGAVFTSDVKGEICTANDDNDKDDDEDDDD